MASKVLDNFTQWAALSVAWTAAGGSTEVFLAQLTTGLSNLQKIAWAVTRFEYFIPAAQMAQIISAGDHLGLGITASNSTAQGMLPTNPSLYDYFRFESVSAAAAGTPALSLIEYPIVHEYVEPILVLPQNIYLMLSRYDAAGLSGVSYARIHYKEVELGPENWYDLLQLRMPLGAV